MVHFKIYAFVLSSLLFSVSLNAGVCTAGMADGFPCNHVDAISILDLKTSGLEAESGNDVWGWTDPLTGREYAIMGMSSKTAFVDITDPTHPIHLGDLATHSKNSIWRDIKVYKNHAFIVSEASHHGLQVFDLKKLRDVNASPAVEFTETAHYNLFGSAHNVVINEDRGTLYAVGSDTCDNGMHMVDIREPQNPKFITCIDRKIFEPEETRSFALRAQDDFLSLKHGEDYTHDAHCVVYQGPDLKYIGQEICVCSNADTVNIVDTTDWMHPVQISVKGYEGLGYTHQGWLTEDHRYFLLGDELDEQWYRHPTKTLIWDVSNLEDPKYIGFYLHETHAIDHNMYVKEKYLYQANYESGLRILSLENVQEAKLKEVAYFDTYPDSDKAQFNGAWSVFPYFQSGTVVVSNIEGQLFVLRPHLEEVSIVSNSVTKNVK